MSEGAGRTLTQGAVLFTDLVGFTEFTEVSGDHAAADALDRQSELVDPVLGGHGDARVVKELGDGLLVWFGTATAGLGAAADLLGVLDRAHEAGDFPLRVRMGLHLGTVVERGDDLVGSTVNLAARIAALAGPGELLVSEDVARACPGADLDAIGPTQLRGVPAPVWLYRVVTG